LPPSFFGQQISTITVQPDGKIIVGGLFKKAAGAPGDLITRLNPEGSVDVTFKLTDFANYYQLPIVKLQADGKIIVSVGAAPFRFNVDGTRDFSFSVPSFFSISLDSLAVQADGHVLMAGRFQSVRNGSNLNIVRLNNDGSLDTNFTPQQRGDSYKISAMESDDGGTIWVAGCFFTNCEIICLNNDGTLKTSFLTPASATTEILTMALEKSGNILVGGGFVWPHGIANVGRMRASGSVDISFQPGFSLATILIPKIVVDSENKVIAALADLEDHTAVQRFNWDGSVDTNFSTTIISGDPTVLTLQKDGKILVASGHFTSGSFTSEFKRVNSDGTVDTGFEFNVATNYIYTALEQPDGKILIGGAFTSMNGLATDRIARLNADGSLDQSFQSLLFLGSPAIENNIVKTLTLQSDGKVLVGTELPSCGCTGAKPAGVFRLNADGSYDPTFDSSEIVPIYVNTLLMQPDGKILVGGFQFSQTDPEATQRHGLIRLNADGSLDTTFTTPLQIGADVRAVFIEPTGKILINSLYSILRLDSDGALDATFTIATADDGEQDTTALSLAPDGNIYFSGSFTSVNHVPRPRLARLFGSPVPIPLKLSAATGNLTFAWSNGTLHLQSATSVDGPYEDVRDATSPWKPSSSEGQQFFRLRSN
jgi:uncharacterized delta-60 repeat protein